MAKHLSWNIDYEDFEGLERILAHDDIAKSAAAAYSGSDLPEEIDYTDKILIENQFSIGSCQGNSISSCTELCYRLSTGEVVQLTRMGAYIWTQELDGLVGRDVGSTIYNGFLVAQKGLCVEALWKYPSRYMTSPPDGSKAEAEANRKYKLLKGWRLKSPDDVMTWLESNQGPIHIGIEWTNSLSNAGDFVTSYGGGGGGGHSVFLAGYRTVRGTRCPKMYNSWSKSWGNNGRTTISRQALDAMFTRRFTVMIGVNGAEGIVAPRYDYITKPVTR